jgi:hypothetical protein
VLFEVLWRVPQRSLILAAVGGPPVTYRRVISLWRVFFAGWFPLRRFCRAWSVRAAGLEPGGGRQALSVHKRTQLVKPQVRRSGSWSVAVYEGTGEVTASWHGKGVAECSEAPELTPEQNADNARYVKLRMKKG